MNRCCADAQGAIGNASIVVDRTCDAPETRGAFSVPRAIFWRASTRGKELQEVAGGTAEKLGQPPWILRRERHLVPDTTQAPQPKSVGPDDAFHMRKSHLGLLLRSRRDC
jgi:hypothetical protein